jgi:polysaccharide deacetylase 2 family uncharacterized protein YibQ
VYPHPVAFSVRRRTWLLAAPLGLLCGLGTVAGAMRLLGPRQATAIDPAPACLPAQPCLAVVIDDIGRDLLALDALLALPADLTFAVLPHAAHTAASREAILGRGRELLLHLPMDPLDRRHITDEPVVVGRDDSVARATRRCLEQVPEAVGVNNHMGSALTQDAAALDAVVGELRAGAASMGRRGDGGRALFVLDSRTSEHSVFCQAARAQGLACVTRDVFLDDPPARPALTSAWERALAAARQRGWAIAVGHPYDSTVEVLRELLRRRQIRVVRLSRLVGRLVPT